MATLTKFLALLGAPDNIYALVNIIVMKELDLHYSWNETTYLLLRLFFAHSNLRGICCTELTSLQQWWMKFKLMRIISFEVIRKVDELCIKHKDYSQFLILNPSFQKGLQQRTTYWVGNTIQSSKCMYVRHKFWQNWLRGGLIPMNKGYYL